MAEPNQQDALEASLDASLLLQNRQRIIQGDLFNIELLYKALERLLESMPKEIEYIAERVDSESCSKQECNQFIDDLHNSRKALLKTYSQWKTCSGSQLKEGIRSSITQVELSSVKLTNDIKQKLVAETPASNQLVPTTNLDQSETATVIPSVTDDQGISRISKQSFPISKAPSYAEGLLTASSRGDVSRYSKSSKRSNESTASMKLKLQTDAAAILVEQKYAQSQTDRVRRQARRDAVRAKQQADEEAERAKRRADLLLQQAEEDAEEEEWERAEQLKKVQESVQAQLSAIEKFEIERNSNLSSVNVNSCRVSSEGKTKAFLNSITNNDISNSVPLLDQAIMPDYTATSRLVSMPVNQSVFESKTTTDLPSSTTAVPTIKPRFSTVIQEPYHAVKSESTTARPTVASSTSTPVIDSNLQCTGGGYFGATSGRPTTASRPTVSAIPAINVPGSSNATPSFSIEMPSETSIQAAPPFNAITGHNNDLNRSSSDRVIEAVCEQMALTRLPIMEPQVFTGQDPLIFPVWKMSFDALIHYKAITDAERLHFLSKYVGGEAKKAIQGFFMLTSRQAYEKSYEMLVERYGDQFKIASAFRQKLKTWPRIGSTDSSGLREFVDFLRQCEAAMTNFTALSMLNDEYENTEISKKLPSWLSRKWIGKVATYREVEKGFPSFSSFVEFLSHEDRVVNDPMALILHSSDTSRETRNITSRSSSFAVEALRSPVDGNNFGGCPFCRGNHTIHNCDNFREKEFEQRQSFVRENRLCYCCLRRGHIARECRNRMTCTICRGPHPSIMHKESLPRTTDNPTVLATSCASHNDFNRLPRKSSMIVPVYLSHGSVPGRERLIYAMLDTQSDTSFVTEETVRALGLEGKETKLILSTMTSDAKAVTCRRFDNLNVRGVHCERRITLPTLFSRESIPANRNHIPKADMINDWPHLEPIRNNLMPKADCEVGLLLGYDCPKALAPKNIIQAPGTSDGPFGMETDLGWGIVGVIGYPTNFCTDQIGFSHRILALPVTGSQIVLPSKTKEVCSPQDCLRLLETDFKDQDHNEEGTSLNERRFLKAMEDGIKVDDSSQYSLPLPFNNRKGELFNNRGLVINRAIMLKKKLDKDPVYREEYKGFMEDMLERGFAERVEDYEVDCNKKVWYIPHFGVFHKIKKKLRIVFDCSAQYKGISLNDTLLKGPDLTNSLIGILCRFREQPIAFCCDIEKMFYAFHVHPSDRDFLRFLWWSGGDTNKPLATYRMTTHIFGAVSSPSCATYGLRSVAKEFEYKYGSSVYEFISRNFYVDDGLKSIQGEEKAKDLIRQTVALCRERGIRLHKFISNSPEVLSSLPKSECAMGSDLLSLDLTEQTTERVLGVLWNVKLDVFQFKVKLKKCLATKREILSATSSIFDPLGWIAPFTLRARGILQQLCKNGLNWDDTVPPDALNDWTGWCEEISALHDLNIRRGFHHADYKDDISVQLHHFADASMRAYGACSYLRIVDNANRVSVQLVMAKARVNPLASVTVPRLELMAAVVAARLSVLLDRELGFKNIEHFFWTDSRIVLGYLSNESKRFKVYVANRVQEIHNTSKPSQWRHVSSQDNPADIASRGITAEALVKSTLWFHGPSFLHHRDLRLKDPEPVTVPADDQEIRRVNVCNIALVTEGLDIHIFSSFSCWQALRRAIARAKCFIRNLKAKVTNDVVIRSKTTLGTGCNDSVLTALSVLDLQDAEQLIIKAVQSSYFSNEIGILRAGDQIQKNSSLYKLDCFVDEFGLLRVGGRLRFAQFYTEQKHPILLPKAAHVSTLIIRHSHQAVKHQGRGMTMNEVRSRGFWIVSLNSQVKKLIHTCVTCRFLRGSTQTQKMADLPPDRLECIPPFTYCGVDLFGPFLIREKRSDVKRYGVIFTCLVSRGVHIEMAYSLSTDAFIQTLRKFLAIRGPIRLLRCDNGTNFVGANKELSKSINGVRSEVLRTFLLENNCEFEFRMNPPSASHMGGAWERLIRVARSILSTLLDQHGNRLDNSSLSTFFYEAAAIINCRPLTLDHITDPNHPDPLTPNHLLTGKSKVVLPPPGQFCKEDVYSIKRWRCIQYLADRFWQRWRDEYLCYLQTRGKWQQVQRDVKVGDIVLIKEDGAFRNDWRKGRVIETYASKDGHIRQVKLRTGCNGVVRTTDESGVGNTLTRPIHKLVLLLPSESDDV